MTSQEEHKWRWMLLDKPTEDLVASRDALKGIPNKKDLLSLVEDELWVRKQLGMEE